MKFDLPSNFSLIWFCLRCNQVAGERKPLGLRGHPTQAQPHSGGDPAGAPLWSPRVATMGGKDGGPGTSP